MVAALPCEQRHSMVLSVLALSSRFDGHLPSSQPLSTLALSVLALSSRFDGLLKRLAVQVADLAFQYSLCRVVLMVTGKWRRWRFDIFAFSTRSVESF